MAKRRQVKKTVKSTPKKPSVRKKSTPKKVSVKKRTYTKKKYTRRKKKLNFSLPIFLLSFLILLIGVFIIYTLFIFPFYLKGKIKKDLTAIYKPKVLDDSDNVFILFLNNKPTYQLQNEAYVELKKKYGLEVKFEKINLNPDIGMNEISFYKKEKQYNDIGQVYIYWNKKLKINNEDNKIVKRFERKKKEKITYEKIEEKRKQEKRERIVKPEKINYKFNKKPEYHEYENKAKIAIVIDDVGYSYNSTYDFLSIGFPVTFAVIPDMAKSMEFYNLFNKYGYDLMLHLPMEPIKGKKYVEKNAIYTDMNTQEVIGRINYFVKKYPGVIGVNNHMGSKAVSDAKIMNIVLRELKKKDLFWLDSMTNIKTITKEVASIYDLSYYERDVFLDNNKNRESIRKSMNLLIKEAKIKGYAVGIGHIQTKELVPVLKEYYNRKDELGIEFVPISKLQ